MRTSLKKLRGFGLHRPGEPRDRKDRRLQQSTAQLDELARASQDMQDMRDCYDGLLNAAAATTNSAYEFSESLGEMGTCLLEKTALNDDEESGKVLLMLGKVQYELQKLVDNYRSHITQTITSPSESLLNELRIVEEMKIQCDEKRSAYEDIITRHKEKGRLRSNKGESLSTQEVQAAYDDYDDEATLFVFRMKSLKQGQSRSLLTQAARHHAAQLCFFRKALKSLETIEPHVKLVTEQQHIDYQFSGLEYDDEDDGDNYDTDDENYGDDDDDDDDGSYNGHDDGELSFDYGQNDLGQNVVSTPRDSMELDHTDVTFPQVATVDAAKENLFRNPDGYSFPLSTERGISSQSAPLSADKKFDPAQRFRQTPPLRSRCSYVLPTPVERKSHVSTGPDIQVSKWTGLSSGTLHYRHSSPLELKKYEKILGNEKLSGPIIPSQPSVLRESNSNSKPTRLPPPLAEELSSHQHDLHSTHDSKKIKRQAFSGPLTGKSWSNKRGLSASGPIVSTVPLPPKLFSGPLLRTPMPQRSSSPKLSPSASPTFVSSPKISELHELPRPPANFTGKFAEKHQNFGYSGPLFSKGQEKPAANKLVSSAASPLPMPPVARSFSIPSRRLGITISHASMALEAPRTLKIAEDIASPPLTPISLSDIQPASNAS